MMTVDQFNHNYDNNINALRNFAFKLTCNTVDSEDLVQETALKAFNSMHTFRKGSNFKSWAFTILKNTFNTDYRKRRRRRVVNMPVEDFSFALESSYSTENDAVTQIKVKEIKTCIQKLSTKCKEPLSLHMEGYQYNEIAEQLDIPVGTVKSRLNYARTKIKTLMEQRGVAV